MFFQKELIIVIPLLFFEGITHAHLLKESVTHNKKRIPLLNLLTNYISSRPTREISIKDEHDFF